MLLNYKYKLYYKHIIIFLFFNKHAIFNTNHVFKVIHIYLVIVTRCIDGYNPYEKVRISKRYVISYVTSEKFLH